MPQGDFATGAFLSLGNPFAVAFWLGVSGSVVSTAIPNPQTSHLIVFFGGFMSGGLLWSVFLAGPGGVGETAAQARVLPLGESGVPVWRWVSSACNCCGVP